MKFTSIFFAVPTRNESRLPLAPSGIERCLRRQRGVLALLATEGRFISPRGACFSTIKFIFPEECCLQLSNIFEEPQR